MPIRFSIAIVAATTAGVALIIANLPFLTFLFALQAVLICAVAELLVQKMPTQLREKSEANCLRINGSWSNRRAAVERRAKSRMRYDLLAVLVMVTLAGDGLAIVVNEIIPIPMAAKAMQLFDLNPGVWKENLRASRVDEEFEHWSMQNAPLDHASVKWKQEILWTSWPVVALVGFLWLLGSFAFVKRSYLYVLQEFAAGVSVRTESNMFLDIARLQSMHASGPR